MSKKVQIVVGIDKVNGLERSPPVLETDVDPGRARTSRPKW